MKIRLAGKEYLIWYGYVGERLVKYLDGEWYFTDNEEPVENGEVIDDGHYLRFFLDDRAHSTTVGMRCKCSQCVGTLCKCSQCGDPFFSDGVRFDIPLLCDECKGGCDG